MKTLLITSIIFLSACASFPPSLQAKSTTFELSDEEIAIVENDVIDAEQWLRDAWNGKVAKCKERMIKKEVDRSVKEREALPAGEDLIIDKAFKRPDYKSRKDREKESEKEIKGEAIEK